MNIIHNILISEQPCNMYIYALVHTECSLSGFKVEGMGLFESCQSCHTSKGLHLLLDSCVHAEVKHELYILLSVVHGDHLMKGQQNY